MISLAFAALISATGPDASGIKWIHDDWSQAQKHAQATKKLVAIDVWATWCHSCLSMKNYVLTKETMRDVSQQHIYLALDYYLEKNTEFFKKYPIDFFPTFLVIDSLSGKVVSRKTGSATAEQMRDFFKEAKVKQQSQTGQQLLAQRNYQGAAKLFKKALSKGFNEELAMGYIEALWGHDKKACALEGHRMLKKLSQSGISVDIGSLVLYGSEKLDKAQKQTIYQDLIAHFKPHLERRPAGLTADDLSNRYDVVSGALEGLDQEKEALKVAAARLTMLEKAAKDAQSASARSTFDYHRMGLYLKLKQADKAVKMLQASQKAEPNNFNHPWRLSLVFLKQKNYPGALKSINRALQVGYGGRKLRLFSTKIDVLLASGAVKEAGLTHQEALALLKKLPATQVRGYWKKEIEGKAEKIKRASP